MILQHSVSHLNSVESEKKQYGKLLTASTNEIEKGCFFWDTGKRKSDRNIRTLNFYFYDFSKGTKERKPGFRNFLE